MANSVEELFQGDEKTSEKRIIHVDVEKLKPFVDYTFPPPSPEEREALKRSIKKHGVHDPLQIVQGDSEGTFTILTGRTRWEIARELGIPTVPCIMRNIPESKRKSFVIYDNVLRRQLTGDKRDKVIKDLRKEGRS